MIDIFEEFIELDKIVNENVKKLHKDMDFMCHVLQEVKKINENHEKQETIKKKQQKIERKKNNMEKIKNMTYWEFMQFKKKLKKERKHKSWDYLVQSVDF